MATDKLSQYFSKAKQEQNKEQGFTMIELLVVILIIGVLAAIAIPAFMNQRKSAVTSALQSDTRNLALSYETWSNKVENTNQKFYELAGGISSAVKHENAVVGSIPKIWNEINGTGDTKISNGSHINIVVVTHKNVTWKRVHQENEFCLGGSNVGSEYDFVSNTGMGSQNYHRVLYYDKALGGVKTAQEIANAMLSGQVASCDGQVALWMTTQGMDTTAYWSKHQS